MSSPRPAVAKLTPLEYFKLVNSPYVKIYVGDQVKPYELPKDLLAHYSPYMRACFNGNFKEGVEGVLRLPDESSRWFDVLVQYVRCSCASVVLSEKETKGPGSASRGRDACFDFIRFCDRFNICEAASAVAKALGKLLDQYGMGDNWKTNFEFAFNCLHHDNPTFKTISRFLVKSLYSNYGQTRQLLENFILGYDGAMPHIFKTEVQMTEFDNRYGTMRKLKNQNNPSYVAEAEEM